MATFKQHMETVFAAMAFAERNIHHDAVVLMKGLESNPAKIQKRKNQRPDQRARAAFKAE